MFLYLDIIGLLLVVKGLGDGLGCGGGVPKFLVPSFSPRLEVFFNAEAVKVDLDL